MLKKERWPHTEAQKEKMREAQRLWGKRNRDKLTASALRWRAKNKDRWLAYMKEYRQENASKILEVARLWREKNRDKVVARILKRHGISFQEYQEMFAAQGGVCAICGETPKTRRLAVDHDHLSGKIRGLLCGSCNRGIGLLGDSPKNLKVASEYLLKFKK